MKPIEGPRAARLNERYYEQFNAPTAKHFGTVHFVDELRRQYRVAAENDDAFQNEHLRATPDRPRCVCDAYGNVTLYVKLLPGAEWFSEQDVGEPLQIKRVVGPPTERTIEVVLQSEEKVTERRRTGRITVSGLGTEWCDQLLLDPDNL